MTGLEAVDVPASTLPAVRGVLHRPRQPSGDGLVLTHGAGGHAGTALLVDVAAAFAGAGVAVLRCDLPFRQARPTGPPSPQRAPADRAGLQHAITVLRQSCAGRIVLGGSSYGGRQASVLAAELPGVADALLLLSYPLHPPARPAALRVDHFPRLKIPVLFVHGTRDPFGSVDELEAARRLIPARTEVLVVEGGHGLARAGAPGGLPARIVASLPRLWR
jgi:predicted alpha/beta-hydrolase family hydrolase